MSDLWALLTTVRTTLRIAQQNIPVTVLSGAQAGPTVLVYAEQGAGVPAILCCTRQFEPEELHGRVIFLPCLCPEGKPIPLDALFAQLPALDFVLELTCAEAGAHTVPVAWLPDQPASALPAAKALNIPVLAPRPEPFHYPYPGLQLQRGSVDAFTAEDIQDFYTDVRLLLAHLHLCGGGYRVRSRSICRRVFHRVVCLHAQRAGLWVPQYPANTGVIDAAMLGYTQDYFARRTVQYHAPYDCHIFSCRNSLAVSPGSALVTYGALSDAELLPVY